MTNLFPTLADLAASGYVFRIVDNGGESADRYTFVTCDGDYLAMSGSPAHPCGVSQSGECSGLQWLSDGVEDGSTENVRGPFIHRPGDDDSAAVTFWGKRDLRRTLAKALKLLDAYYIANPTKDFGDDGRFNNR